MNDKAINSSAEMLMQPLYVWVWLRRSAHCDFEYMLFVMAMSQLSVGSGHGEDLAEKNVPRLTMRGD